ncbi:ABC transporter permease [Oscillibacter sp.]|uniref:ABC transporter permease n=1 Tax=Oscillibacter sp. TaxID=1945593 RepID=UPI002D7EC33C|nr:ABC transporter permease [Oscillibacter sp.]
MRSKTSYFNPTLFRKSLARFWPLWGGASAVGALFPLAFLTILIREHALFGEPMSDPLSVTAGYYHIVAWIIPVLSLLYAALCALTAWGWLYSPKSVGMYHSLPVTRKGIFLTDFLSGMAMMLIPYAVTGALCIAVSAVVGGLDPVGLGVTILSVLGLSFFFFASATAVAFITGNPFAFAGFYFIFHFIAAGLEWLVTLLTTMFYFGVERSYQGVVQFLSPAMYLTRKLNVDSEYTQVINPEGWEESVLESVTLVNGHLIALYALAGVVLLAFAWGLYRRRRSESAGDVVAVGWMKPVFRYGVALCAALAGGMALYGLFFEDYRTAASALPMAVCMAIAGLIGYYIASMLLAKSLRVFRGTWKGALATLLAAVALCFAVAADPLGMETWVPREEQVQQVRFWMRGWNGPGVSVLLDDPAAIQQVLELHQAIVEERDALDRDRFAEETHYAYFDLDYYEDPENYDGRVNRSYHLPCNDLLMKTSEALQKLTALAADPLIQEANVFSNISGENIEARLTGGYAARLYNPETKEMEQVDLTLDQAKALEAAVRRDIQAGHFGRTMFMLDDGYEKAAYTGDLDLYYAVTYPDHPRQGPHSQPVSLSLSVYCTETVKALEDLGIVNESRKLLTYAERDALDNEEKGIPYTYEDPYTGYYEEGVFPADTVYPGDAYVYPGEEVDAALLH